MARANVTTQQVTRAGLNLALTAAVADGDIVDPGSVILVVANGSGSAVTVTVQSSREVDGLAVADLTVSVPASGTRHIGPFPASTFAQASDAVVGPSRVLVDYSAVGSVTRGVLKV